MNDVVSFLCSDKQKIFNTYNVCVLCVSKQGVLFKVVQVVMFLTFSFEPLLLPCCYYDSAKSLQHNYDDHTITHVLTCSNPFPVLSEAVYENVFKDLS